MMGILSFLDPVLNLLFGPLLQLSYFWAILILSVIISLLITLIYKWTTDQNLMKQLKGETKALQKQMKELKDRPEEMMKVQKEMMQTNWKYMSHSLRPMLFTFIPIILIFGWMNAHLAYAPIFPGQEFQVSARFANGDVQGNASITVPEGITLISEDTQQIEAKEATWTMKGPSGAYVLEVEYGGKIFTKDLLITKEKNYVSVQKPIKDGGALKAIGIKNAPVKILNLFGWKVGWLGTYIIFSIVASMLLRKGLKVY